MNAFEFREKKQQDLVSDIKKNAHFVRINCRNDNCPSFTGCTQLPSQGNKESAKKNPKVFFLFEGAASEDGRFNIPAVSQQGKYFRDTFLTDFISQTSVTKKTTPKLQITQEIPYLITHLVRSTLTTESGSPRGASVDELRCCWEIFNADLLKFKPEVIMAFGGSAYTQLYSKARNKRILPDPDTNGIGKLRTKIIEMEFDDDYKPLVIVTYAPAFILRSPATATLFTEDCNKLIWHFRPELKVEKPVITIDKVTMAETVDQAIGYIDFLIDGKAKKEPIDVAFDTETDNLNKMHNNKFLSWQFTHAKGEALFIPIEHPDKPLFANMSDKVRLIQAFQTFLNSSPNRTNVRWLIMHNAKFDLGVLYGLFKILPRGSIPIWDTQLGMHWLDENRKGMSATLDGKPYSLKTLGKELFTDIKGKPFEYSSETLAARAEGELSSLALKDLVDYGGTDTILTWQLKQEQMRLANAQPSRALAKLERFMRYYFSPASRAVAVMECNGLYVSKENITYLQGKDSPIWSRMEKIENIDLQNSPEVVDFREKFKSTIEGQSDGEYEDIWASEIQEEEEIPLFDPNKKVQETAFLLDYLKLTPLKVSKKTNNASLDKEFLKTYSEMEAYLTSETLAPYRDYYKTPIGQTEDGDPLFPKNPLQLILEYRELKKLGSTYLEGIDRMVRNIKGDCVDGRVRASFWLSGTDTGRLSSSDPNFQNLPSGRTKAAKSIKNLFQAEPPSKKYPNGTALVQLDYKTAEVRWAAIFAKDRNMIRIFNEAREALLKACDPNANMSDKEFENALLESDLHRRTASLMFGVPPMDVSKTQRQASKCLVGSTLIYTNKGIISLEDMVTDKEDSKWCQPITEITTATHEGYTDILCVNHKWVDSTISLDTEIGVNIEGDKEHQLLVWENCQIIEKALRDIQEGDILITSRTADIWPLESPKINCSIENEMDINDLEDTVTCQICEHPLGNLNSHVKIHGITISDYKKQFPYAPLVSPAQIARRMNSLLGTIHNIDIPKCPDHMTSSLARILGYLVAEGDGQRYTMSGNVTKSQEMLHDFLNCMEDCFGVSFDVSEYPQFTTTGIVRMPQKLLRYLLNLGLIKGYSDTQRVPKIIFKSQKEEVVAFLRAYFEGDGCVKQNCVVAMSASELLMNDIQQLLLNLNIVSKKFSENRITPVGKEIRPYYGLSLSIRDSCLFRDQVGFISKTKNDKLAKLKLITSRDSIYGLEALLQRLKLQFKVSKGKLYRYAINGKSVKFGERRTKDGRSEITHELLALRPYVLDAIKAWSEYEGNSVYDDIMWLHTTKSRLVKVTKKTIKNDKTKVYDIEVNNPKHIFLANGFLSKNCITFGLFFGMSTSTLAANNGWTEEEAEDKVYKFFSAFPEIKKYLDEAPRKAKEQGYLETIMGRRRRLDFLFNTKEFRNEAKASRLAMNAPIQGQSSDAGMVGLFTFLQYLIDNNLERRWLIENAVHDSCLIQVPIEDVEKALPIIQFCFVDGMKEYIGKYFNFALPLPIECEIEIGLEYGDLEKWDGRPSTLPTLLDKIKVKADKMWKVKEEIKQKKPPMSYDLIYG